MNVNLQNRVAVVTGGASGIGRATAIMLAQHGARVFVGDLKRCPENRDLFAAYHIEESICDVRSEQQVRDLIDRAVCEAGSLHILVSNAGINQASQVPDTTEEQWDACIDTNLKGASWQPSTRSDP